MADGAPDREAWITGIGIVSCLGEGPDAHWQALSAGKPQADTETFAPYIIHRIAALDFDKQIPKKGDQRQMEPWQRIGTYAAGLALDSAGIKGNADILARTDMIVAAGGGERDVAVDTAILSGLPTAEKPEAFLNERLMSDLRPTLFLAQLSNLLAGNISIVHGVTGSSRTFMGEEAVGRRRGAHRACADRCGPERHRAGRRRLQCRAARPPDALRVRRLQPEGQVRAGVGARANPGFALGSLGAFLVIESREHAEARGAKRLARLERRPCPTGRSRKPGDVTAALAELWSKIAGSLASGKVAVISGASGAEPATAEERAFLDRARRRCRSAPPAPISVMRWSRSFR